MQRTIFLYGLVVAAIGLFAMKMLVVNAPEPGRPKPLPEYERPLEQDTERVIAINANEPGWKPIGKGPIRMTADGTVDLGGLKTQPDDKQRPGDERVLVPRFPYGRLLAKYGENGNPFSVGKRAQFAQKEVVYVAINDSDYSDNSGAYIVTVIGGNKY